MSDREELRSRLRRLGRAVSLPEHIRERHLIAIAEALDEPVAGVSWGRGRRALAAWVAAVVVAVPSVAFASESALPGQVLYPVKRAVERAWSVVDPDLPARHRLEELEALSGASARPGRLDQAVHDAVTAADNLPAADPLKLELEQTIERVAAVSPTTVASGQNGTEEDSVKEPWWDAEENGGHLASTTTTAATEDDASSSSAATVADDSEHESTEKTTTTTERDGGDESHGEEDDH